MDERVQPEQTGRTQEPVDAVPDAPISEAERERQRAEKVRQWVDNRLREMHGSVLLLPMTFMFV